MLVYLRESLLSLLLKIGDIAPLYEQGGADVPRAVHDWLKEGEALAARLRLPLAGELAQKRMQLMAVIDGMEQGYDGSRARIRRHAAITLLGEAEASIREIVRQQDEKIAAYKDKLAQLLAVSSSSEPLQPRAGRTVEAWAADVWKNLKPRAETRNMTAWLAASLDRSDLMALLAEILATFAENGNGDGG